MTPPDVPSGSILDTLTAHRAVATIPAVITDQLADKYWLDAVSERTFSITGALAIAMGGWLLSTADRATPVALLLLSGITK